MTSKIKIKGSKNKVIQRWRITYILNGKKRSVMRLGTRKEVVKEMKDEYPSKYFKFDIISMKRRKNYIVPD